MYCNFDFKKEFNKNLFEKQSFDAHIYTTRPYPLKILEFYDTYKKYFTDADLNFNIYDGNEFILFTLSNYLKTKFHFNIENLPLCNYDCIINSEDNYNSAFKNLYRVLKGEKNINAFTRQWNGLITNLKNDLEYSLNNDDPFVQYYSDAYIKSVFHFFNLDQDRIYKDEEEDSNKTCRNLDFTILESMKYGLQNINGINCGQKQLATSLGYVNGQELRHNEKDKLLYTTPHFEYIDILNLNITPNPEFLHKFARFTEKIELCKDFNSIKDLVCMNKDTFLDDDIPNLIGHLIGFDSPICNLSAASVLYIKFNIITACKPNLLYNLLSDIVKRGGGQNVQRLEIAPVCGARFNLQCRMDNNNWPSYVHYNFNFYVKLINKYLVEKNIESKYDLIWASFDLDLPVNVALALFYQNLQSANTNLSIFCGCCASRYTLPHWILKFIYDKIKIIPYGQQPITYTQLNSFEEEIYDILVDKLDPKKSFEDIDVEIVFIDFQFVN